jgi:hypothetical protein
MGNRHRFMKFAEGFFAELALTGRAPTPTDLNRWMGLKKSHNLSGELTRWRTFLLTECGFSRSKSGRWRR